MSFKTLVAHTDDGETYRISLDGGRYKVSVSPEYHRKGTEVYSGNFPRRCTSLRGAKSVVTKWLGYKPDWVEESNTDH